MSPRCSAREIQGRFLGVLISHATACVLVLMDEHATSCSQA
jgi:hypothetical protein